MPTLNFASLGVQWQSSGNRPDADSPREDREFDEVTLVGEEMPQDLASHVEKSEHTCCSAHEGLVELRQRIHVLELFGSVEQSAGQAALESKLCASPDVGRGPVPIAGLLRQLPDPLEYQLSPEATVAALQQMRWVLVATVTHMGSVAQDAAMTREDVLGSEREHKRLGNKVDDLADTIVRAEGYGAEEESHAALREVRMAMAEAHFAHDISHVRGLLVECGKQVLAMKADLEKLIPRVADLECTQPSLQRLTQKAVHHFDSKGSCDKEEVLVQSLDTMVHSGPLSSASTLRNEDALEVSPAGSSEVPQSAEIRMHFRPGRSASPSSRSGSSGPWPRCNYPVFEQRENSSCSPLPRSDMATNPGLAASGGSGTQQQPAERSHSREPVGSPGMTLEDKTPSSWRFCRQSSLDRRNFATTTLHERLCMKGSRVLGSGRSNSSRCCQLPARHLNPHNLCTHLRHQG